MLCLKILALLHLSGPLVQSCSFLLKPLKQYEHICFSDMPSPPPSDAVTHGSQQCVGVSAPFVLSWFARTEARWKKIPLSPLSHLVYRRDSGSRGPFLRGFLTSPLEVSRLSEICPCRVHQVSKLLAAITGLCNNQQAMKQREVLK